MNSFIPNHMRFSAIEKRLKILMETDWKAEATLLLERRQKEINSGKEAYVGPSLSALSIKTN